ncbi:hypothetical protein [Nocardioides piscis]|uniref:Uncharacterized protein n=1 Tax=Nocardioides piscis TaxID=2714938 RepID=A0A6G7YCZ4_9ACTN|nr:hypothetical protein [Nocardioides piscis]QIK74692.1 hypothetical protein G7071_03915 [Nocardioides piscis]
MTGRRIAAALLTATMSLGSIGLIAGPAEAKDTTWPTFVDTTKVKPAPSTR